MHNMRKAFIGLCALAVIAITMIGCGDDKDKSSQTTATQSTTTTANETVNVPNVNNDLLADAETEIEQLDLETAEIEEHSDSVDEGRVIKTVPKAGSEVKKGLKVTLYVSKGSDQSPKSPSGSLEADGIGDVKMNVTESEVEDKFGKPDRKREVNFGGGPAPQLDWIWDYEGKFLRIYFDTKTDKMVGYETDSPKFATSAGYKVGSPYAPIKRRYKKKIRPFPIGGEAHMLSKGKPGTFPALVFATMDGKVVAISGGDIQPAGD